MEKIEIEVTRYNQRRNAVYAGISSSEIIQQDMDDNIKTFRNCRNEKWWDGGEYMAIEKEQQRLINEKDK